MLLGGLSSAIAGMHRYASQFDRAAEQVARAGLVDLDPDGSQPTPDDVAPPIPQGAAAGAEDDFTDGMINMMIAQRMFAASTRVAKTSDEMLREIIYLGERD